jgi:hypothetical protein
MNGLVVTDPLPELPRTNTISSAMICVGSFDAESRVGEVWRAWLRRLRLLGFL